MQSVIITRTTQTSTQPRHIYQKCSNSTPKLRLFKVIFLKRTHNIDDHSEQNPIRKQNTVVLPEVGQESVGAPATVRRRARWRRGVGGDIYIRVLRKSGIGGTVTARGGLPQFKITCYLTHRRPWHVRAKPWRAKPWLANRHFICSGWGSSEIQLTT